MTSREELDDSFAKNPVVGSEPREDIYGRLGIHPHRLTARALPMEAKVWAKSLLRNDDPKPFLIYGRPRSGTTLLVRLLDQVPAVRCDGELLHNFLVSPVRFLRRLPRRAGPDVQAYGVKLISYQLMEVQRIRRPLAFFDKVAGYGYGVVHLTRDTWDQTLSLAKAQASGLYFTNKARSAPRTLRLDPDRFLALLRWNEAMLAYEKAVMAHVEHFQVCYEHGLSKAPHHQPTIDELCAYLGIPSAEVGVNMRRTGGKTGLQKVENLEDLAAHVRRSNLAHLVPDEF
jgi:LPS sulfotransferase NodH